MATAIKKPMDEEAHFRIDELVRQIDGIGKALTPETVAALVQGAVAALQATTDAKLERILTAQSQDITSDAEVVKAIRDLIEVLKTPVTRTSTVMLPSGPVTMTTTEKK